jgi:hypothetical protein
MSRQKLAFLWLCVGIFTKAHAQGFEGWFDKQIADIVNKQASQTATQQVGQNGKSSDRQRQSPSADSRSTSLVDQSSATDFVSIAASLLPVPSSVTGATSAAASAAGTTTGGSSSAAGSGTATTSLYAILAGLNGTSPIDPQFYKNHVDARRISFTAGTAASTVATDNTDKPATVLGTKFLFVNHRELYTKANLVRIADVQKHLSDATTEAALHLKQRIHELMYQDLHPTPGRPSPADLGKFIIGELNETEFPKTLAKLKSATLEQITDLLTSDIAVFTALDKTIKNTYDQIQKGTQVSLSYTANVRKDIGNNYHRAEFIVDYGVSSRINWTFNASADYTDRKAAKDSRGGRVATDFTGDLTKSNSAWGRLPMRLSFSGEAKWLTSQKPQYTVQAQLTIPVSQGVDLPIVYRYANREAQLNRTNSEVRLGFSVDVSRLAQALK